MLLPIKDEEKFSPQCQHETVFMRIPINIYVTVAKKKSATYNMTEHNYGIF